MEGVEIGKRVRLRPASTLRQEQNLPSDALGTVVARYVVTMTPRRVWLDVDFGPEVGLLRSVSAEEFELVRTYSE